ncbi:hypothetical protein Tco_0203396 [Tanacetum coccineum]
MQLLLHLCIYKQLSSNEIYTSLQVTTTPVLHRRRSGGPENYYNIQAEELQGNRVEEGGNGLEDPEDEAPQLDCEDLLYLQDENPWGHDEEEVDLAKE